MIDYSVAQRRHADLETILEMTIAEECKMPINKHLSINGYPLYLLMLKNPITYFIMIIAFGRKMGSAFFKGGWGLREKEYERYSYVVSKLVKLAVELYNENEVAK